MEELIKAPQIEQKVAILDSEAKQKITAGLFLLKTPKMFAEKNGSFNKLNFPERMPSWIIAVLSQI